MTAMGIASDQVYALCEIEDVFTAVTGEVRRLNGGKLSNKFESYYTAVKTIWPSLECCESFMILAVDIYLTIAEREGFTVGVDDLRRGEKAAA